MMNQKNLIIGAVALLVLLWIGLLYRDTRMTDEAHEEYGTPELVVRGLDLEREISGDVWVLHSMRAERYEKINRLESIEVIMTTANGDVWLVNAPEGTVTHDGGEIRLFDPLGRRKDEKKPLFWTAPEALWDGKKEVWFFSEGIHLWDDTVDVKGRVGTLRPGGKMRLEKGVTVSWKRPED
ncbi:MAG: hypothetical protein ACLFN0_09950 [Thermovirgaceae bacterium]